jgi:putative salt-induced outer membrane protein YdiY
MRHPPLLLAATLLCVAHVAAADQVIFQNGDRLSGKILTMDAGKLEIDTAVAGKVKVEWKQVATFSSDERVELRLADGSTVAGQAEEAAAGNVRVVEAGVAEPTPVALEGTVKVNPEPVRWKGNLGAGFNLQRGNTDTTGGSVDLRASRRSESDRITLDASYASSRETNQETGQSLTTARRMDGGLQYDYFFTKKLYGFALARGERDGLAALDLRATAGTGLGYQIFESSERNLSVQLGPTWIGEYYSNDTPDHQFAALRAGWSFEQLLYEGISFFHRGHFATSVEGFDHYLADAETGLRYKLVGDFYGETKLLWLYDSAPAEDRKRQDLSLMVGLGYGF